MSRDVAELLSKEREDDLTEDEVLYLLQRGYHHGKVVDPAQLEEIRQQLDLSGQNPPHYYPNTGDVNTRGETIEELEARLARMKAEQGIVEGSGGEAADAMRKEVKKQRRPITADDEDLDDEDEDEDSEEEEDDEDATTYEEKGWTNDSRRSELSRRGLSVEGDKEALIARLIRSDNDELLDEDRAGE